MTERAASKQGEAFAALREGSKVLSKLRPERRRSTAGSEHTSLERPDNVGSHRIRTATDIGYLRVSERSDDFMCCNDCLQSLKMLRFIGKYCSMLANVYSNGTIASSLPRVRPGSPKN